MSVSVVVISFNSEKTLPWCLASLEAQTSKAHEVIVVEAGDHIETGASTAKVIFDPRGSQAHSRNLGAKSSTGSILAFLDSDCAAPPGWVKQIVEDFEGGASAMGGPYLPAQETDFASTAHRLIAASFGRTSATFAGLGGGFRRVSSVSGGNCAFDRSLFLDVGGYDERQHWREEPELGRRIRAEGVPIIFDPQLFVNHMWTGWDGLLPLARVAFFYGRIRVKSRRELES